MSESINTSTLEGLNSPYCDAHEIMVTADGDDQVERLCRVYGEGVTNNEGAHSDVWVIWRHMGESVLGHSSILVLPSGPLPPCPEGVNTTGAVPVD